MAPDVVRPNSEYDMAITLLGTNQPVRVRVDIGGPRDSGGYFLDNTDVEVEPYVTKLAKLRVSLVWEKCRRWREIGIKALRAILLLEAATYHQKSLLGLRLFIEGQPSNTS